MSQSGQIISIEECTVGKRRKEESSFSFCQIQKVKEKGSSQVKVTDLFFQSCHVGS